MAAEEVKGKGRGGKGKGSAGGRGQFGGNDQGEGGGGKFAGGKAGGAKSSSGKAADWTCPKCGDNVFASRDACRQCNTPKPADAESGKGGSGKSAGKAGGAKTSSGKAADWTCPKCGDNVFASRDACRQCNTPKPADADSGKGGSAKSAGGKAGGSKDSGVKPGDWTCPECGENVFASRDTCRKCFATKPAGAGGEGSEGKAGGGKGKGGGGDKKKQRR